MVDKRRYADRRTYLIQAVQKGEGRYARGRLNIKVVGARFVAMTAA